MKKIILSTILFAAFFSSVNAQVKFKIDWLEAEQAYQVSLVSEATWNVPMNITSSGQVSLKAPAGGLDVYNLNSLQNDVTWELSAVDGTPAEAPEHDYISIGLASMGTNGIVYESGKEIPLFTFQNAADCQGAVELVDNETDVFMPPNSHKSNIGNQLTVLGAGGNAYTGFIGEGKAVCSFVSAAKEEVAHNKITIYPTNVTDDLNIEMDWKNEAVDVTVRVFGANGKQAFSKTVSVQKGANHFRLDAGSLRGGVYSVKIESENMEKTAGRFVKI